MFYSDGEEQPCKKCGDESVLHLRVNYKGEFFESFLCEEHATDTMRAMYEVLANGVLPHHKN